MIRKMFAECKEGIFSEALVPCGGLEGQVLTKSSDEDFDIEWGDSVGGSGGTGKDGLSAYEVAVKNGFVGTEQEWIESITTVSITPYEAWQNWRDIDPANNTQSFDEWIDAKLRLGDDEVSRIRAKLAWEAAKLDTEYWTGKYHMDGRKIYGKVIDFGALPGGSGTKTVPHNINNFETLVSMTGIMFLADNQGPMPPLSPNMGAYGGMFDLSPLTHIRVVLGTYGRTNANAIFTLEYTCSDR